MDIIRALFGVGLVLAVCSIAFIGRDWDGGTRLGVAVAGAGIEYRPDLYQAVEVPPAPAASSVAAPEPLPILPPPEPILVVDTEALNLRAGPTTSAEVLRALSRGTAVTEEARNGNWVQVRTSDGTVGWMSRRYLQISPQQTLAL